MPLTVPNPPAREEIFEPPALGCGTQSWDHPPLEPPSFTRIGAPRPLALWHLASFDAPTVAVVWSLGFAWAADTRLPLWVPALLALTVWAVYAGDRLLDARSGLHDPGLNRLRERHYFHWRHRRLFLPLAAVAAGSAALLVLMFMPAAARDRGSILAAVSLAYFARVHSGHRARPFFSPLLSKEMLVGLLFTFGCALPVLGRLHTMAHAPAWPILCSLAFFAVLAWLNCHAIDTWETRKCGSGRSPIFLQSSLIGVTGVSLAGFALYSHPRVAALFFAGALSALSLAWLDRRRRRFTPVALRAAADLVLLTPALVLPIAALLGRIA